MRTSAVGKHIKESCQTSFLTYNYCIANTLLRALLIFSGSTSAQQAVCERTLMILDTAMTSHHVKKVN